MKKVVYSVTKYVGDKFTKLSSIGCIADNNLAIACMSKSNKPYTRCKECNIADAARDEFVGHSHGTLENAYTDLSDEYLLKEGKKFKY